MYRRMQALLKCSDQSTRSVFIEHTTQRTHERIIFVPVLAELAVS
jgi:hypothetical protein